ncbi:TonB family protein [Archangium violaceum]|uniref:TonB family protein n=1 Tax=Archangium violaceum TaxID=83451 RepID=UPI001EF3D8BC|nr:TonB family protein [Archangium violaceum]
MRTPEPPPERESGAESIAEIILGPVKPRTPGVLVWAAVATVSLHGVAGVFAWRVWQEGASRAPPVAAPKPPIRVDHVVDLRPQAIPEPPPPVSPPAPPPPRQQRQRAARAETPPSRAKPTNAPPSSEPARAGEVVAVKEGEAPLDFTGFDIVSGQAESYAGGVTASNGSSARAVEAVAGSGDDANGTGTSRARPIRLPARNWDCPWPREADTLRINEQTVVLRVVVTPEGQVTSAELVSDPGHGFGQAALACARGARFDAALDRDGRPYAATSPPIRVRFKRR